MKNLIEKQRNKQINSYKREKKNLKKATKFNVVYVWPFRVVYFQLFDFKKRIASYCFFRCKASFFFVQNFRPLKAYFWYRTKSNAIFSWFILILFTCGNTVHAIPNSCKLQRVISDDCNSIFKIIRYSIQFPCQFVFLRISIFFYFTIVYFHSIPSIPLPHITFKAVRVYVCVKAMVYNTHTHAFVTHSCHILRLSYHSQCQCVNALFWHFD